MGLCLLYVRVCTKWGNTSNGFVFNNTCSRCVFNCMLGSALNGEILVVGLCLIIPVVGCV